MTSRAFKELGFSSLCVWLLASACLPAHSQTTRSRPAYTGRPVEGAYRIAGTVINASTGEAIRRAAVAVLAEEDSRTVAAVESDNEGHFAIERLAAGKYQLTVSKRGYRTAFYDEHDEFNTAIVTGPDQDTGNIQFKLSPGAILRGVVTADGGDPVEGARVMLFRKPGAHRPDERLTQADMSVTDDTGSYEFTGLAAGDYLIAVAADPWYALHDSPNRQRKTAGPADEAKRALDVTYPVTFFDSTTEEAAAATITLASGGRDEADINLHAVPALRLTVETPRKQDGSIARAELRQTIFGTMVSAVSAGYLDAMQTGTTEFGGVAPGHYEISQGDPPRVADLDASTNQLVDAGIGVATGSISGTVRTDAGSGLPEQLSLVLESADGAQRTDPIQTNAFRGKFAFPSVLPGEYTLSIQDGSRSLPVASIAESGHVHLGSSLKVRGSSQSIVVTASEGATRLQGFAKKGDKGVAGAMIVLVPRDLAAYRSLVRRDQSDSDGSFALRDVVPGQYTIVALEDAWELNWSDPVVIGRYLPGGVAVTLSDTASKTQSLAVPVPVQMR